MKLKTAQIELKPLTDVLEILSMAYSKVEPTTKAEMDLLETLDKVSAVIYKTLQPVLDQDDEMICDEVIEVRIKSTKKA